MKVVLLVILGFIASSYAEVTSCYYCESKEHPQCIDEFDKTTGTTVNCKEFIDSIKRPEVNRSSRKALPFSRGFTEEKPVENKTVDYRCVKTKIGHSDSSIELLRVCVPLEPTVSTACGFLKQYIGEEYTMKTCHECSTDNCNGSPFLVLSLWSIIACLLSKLF